MKLIIAGTRTFSDYALLKEVVDRFIKEIGKITEIVSGGATGADLLGENYANKHDIPIKNFFPNWSLGKKAGPLRNRKMAEYADCALIFWDGASRGGKSMIEEMSKVDKPYNIIRY